jgi:hypothetical protein
MKKMKLIQSLIVLLIPVIFNSCATITKDDSQPVSFSSEPQGAEVSLNNLPVGTTPTTVMVKKKFGKTMVTYKKDGYETQTFPLDKSVAAMTFGNIIFGGIIGAGVDVATGKATNYQESVHVKLIPKNGSSPPATSTSNSNFQPPTQPRPNQSMSASDKKTEARRRIIRLYATGAITKEEYDEMIKEIR